MLQRFVAGVLLVGVSLGAQERPERESEPQPKGYRFGAEVVVIPVPVFVSDGEGQPVEGLTQEDFIVKEQGKPRPIVYFEPVSDERLAAASGGERSAPLPPGIRRHFLLFFDLTFSSPRGLLRAREAALDFLRSQVAETDLVGAATYSNIGGLKMLSNFSTNHERTARVVATLGLVKATDIIQDPVGFIFDASLQRPQGPGNVPSGAEDNQRLSQLADELRSISDRLKQSDENDYRNRAADFLGQFLELGRALGSLSGRKHVLLLSQGIQSRFVTGAGLSQFDEDFEKLATGRVGDINTDTRFGRVELRDMLMQGLTDAAASDVVIHALDISGLGGEPGEPTGRGEGGGQDTLFLMANETGGKLYKNVNDLKQPLASIVKETSSYYLIGFQPEKLERRGRLRSIDVEVKRPGVRVSARRGYIEPKATRAMNDAERKLQVAEFVTKDIVSEDVFMEALAAFYPGQPQVARVPVVLKFPGAQFLKDKRTSDVLRLDVYGYAIGSGGALIDFFQKTLSFDLKKERDRFEKAGFQYYDLLFAPPGPLRLKLIAMDIETGKVGSFIEDIEVPDFEKGGLVVSTPLFVTPQPDWIMAQGIDPERPEPRRQGLPTAYPFRTEGTDFVPAVRPRLSRSAPSNVLIRVYNLELHPQSGQPQTEMKFERIDEHDALSTLRQVGLLRRPDSPEPGCFELAFEVKWDEIPTGPAVFRMTLTDLLAKKTERSGAAFVLEH